MKMAIPSAVRIAALLIVALFVVNSVSRPQEAAPRSSEGTHRSYLGFDRNIYPGDDALPILRKTFAFSSYWLSPPPGEKQTLGLANANSCAPKASVFLFSTAAPKAVNSRHS